MSIASMTEIAFQSRTDVGQTTYFPKNLMEISGAAGGKDSPDSQVNTAIRTLTTYIPTETLTLLCSRPCSSPAINKGNSHDPTMLGDLLVLFDRDSAHNLAGIYY